MKRVFASVVISVSMLLSSVGMPGLFGAPSMGFPQSPSGEEAIVEAGLPDEDSVSPDSAQVEPLPEAQASGSMRSDVPESVGADSSEQAKVLNDELEGGGPEIAAESGVEVLAGRQESAPTITPRARRLSAQANPLSCDQGDYYTLTADGYVSKVSSTNGAPDSDTAPVMAFPVYEDEGESFNGLAIGAQGHTVYGLNRRAGDDGDELAIYRWRSNEGGKRVYLGSMPPGYRIYDHNNHVVEGVERGALVAGGIDPTDPRGAYYFGGFFQFRRQGDSNRHVYFDLLKLEGNQVSRVGYIHIRKHGVDSSNGDIAFSGAGDLFILWNNGDKKTKIVSVLKRDLLAANGGEIEVAGATDEIRTGSGQYNGLAFDADGNLFIQYSKKGDITENYAIDPDTGELAAGGPVRIYPSGNRAGSDLASCASPSTLYLVKNLEGREKAGDQFEIQVTGKNGSVLATDETQGDDLGIAASVGVFIVKKGRDYILSEVPTQGASMSDYNTTFECRDFFTNTVVATQPVAGSANTHKLFIAQGDSRDYVCTFTNRLKPKVGSISWTKTGEGRTQPLAGSAWRIAPTGAGAHIDVTDNTGAASYNGVDEDPAQGRFKVSNIPFGQYELQEAVVPEGFLPPQNHTRFEINAVNSAAVINLGQILNRRITGNVTWSKVNDAQETLAGSQWVLTGTAPAVPAKEINDCQSAPCPSEGDQDSRPGVFQLKKLPYGNYTLTEKTAPVGYVLDSQTRPITINSNNQTVSLGPIVNKRAVGTVRWQKTNDRTPAQYLAGSQWLITPTNPTGTPIAIKDCMASPCAAQDRDTDPAPGRFTVGTLPLGDYSLKETLPPVGYKIAKDAKPFTINTHGQQANLGRIVNVQLDPLVIPLTGGTSSGFFFAIGTATLLVGTFGAYRARPTRKKVSHSSH